MTRISIVITVHSDAQLSRALERLRGLDLGLLDVEIENAAASLISQSIEPPKFSVTPSTSGPVKNRGKGKARKWQ